MANFAQYFNLLAKGEIDQVRRLVENDPMAAEARDDAGVSLLMHSLYRGQRDLAEAIASKKAELDIFEAASLGRGERLGQCVRDASQLNSRSKDGFTALHFACFFHQPEAARLLIEAGASVDAIAENSMRVMPLHSRRPASCWRAVLQ